MSEVLSFDVALNRPGFALQMAADLPLQGITAITGPSGSGKTTLLRILSGLEPAARGHVHLGARVLQDKGVLIPPHQRGIGYVFQEPRLFPHLDVTGNLGFGARRRGVGQGRIDEIVAVLDLGALLRRDIRGLSGGEARRVALGRVLASGPDILFLDEPMTGLDAARKAEILPHIARAAQAFGLPALFVSHARDEVLCLSDRVLTLAGGRITGWAPPPVRLCARVVARDGAGAVLAIGGDTLRLPISAQPGETWSLALPEEGAVLCAAAPGANSAVLTLAGQVRAVTPETLQIEIAGQSLNWPLGAALAGGVGGLAPGARVWLQVLQVLARPESGPAFTDAAPDSQASF